MAESVERATIDLTVNPRYEQGLRAAEDRVRKFKDTVDKAGSGGGGGGDEGGGGGGGGGGDEGGGGGSKKGFFGRMASRLGKLRLMLDRLLIPVALLAGAVVMIKHLEAMTQGARKARLETEGIANAFEHAALSDLFKGRAGGSGADELRKISENARAAEDAISDLTERELARSRMLGKVGVMYGATDPVEVLEKRAVRVMEKIRNDEKAAIQEATRRHELRKRVAEQDTQASVAASRARGSEGIFAKRAAEDEADAATHRARMIGATDDKLEQKRIERQYAAERAARSATRQVEDRDRLEASKDRKRDLESETTGSDIEKARIDHERRLEEIHRRFRHQGSVEEQKSLADEHDAEMQRYMVHLRRMADAAKRQHKEMLEDVQRAQIAAFGPSSIPLDMLSSQSGMEIMASIIPSMIRSMGGH